MCQTARLTAAIFLLAAGAAGGCSGFTSVPRSSPVIRQEPFTLIEESDAQIPLLLARDANGQAYCTASDSGGLVSGFRDYAGVLHVHTRYSYDADGYFEDVVRVANAQHLDFVAITEHNMLQPLREGRGGRYGETLVVIGMEITTQGGHYLTLNVTHEVDRLQLTTQEVIDAVALQEGFGFIAHPYFNQRAWIDWSVRGFTGMEIFNASHDLFDENLARLAFWTLSATPLSSYLSIVNRPARPLRAWDEMMRRHGRVVGIGSTDAHEVHVFGMKFASYEAMFQMARTHVLTTASPLTPGGLYEALRAGHAYVSLDLFAEPSGFIFRVDADGSTVGIMGDAVSFRPGLTLVVASPSRAEIVLYRDGQVIDRQHAESFNWKIDQPGVYRVELSLGGKPWIFSNPVYVE
jgi:histidinol phosphatase-like PHP family hydrolase